MSFEGKGLGRRFAPDARDKNFPMRLMLDPLREQFFPRGLPPGTRHYRSGPVLDQGNTGTCVGHGWAAWSQGAPLMIKPTADMDPMYLYDQFIKDDEWSENDNDTERQFGTSVRAGAKHLQKTGRVKSYLWAEGVEDVRAWHLSNFGTVVLGVNWYTGMFEPDSEGYIKVSGIVEGGHCVKTTGWNDTARPGGVVYGQNSWDEDWGVKGRFRIRRDDLERLIMEQGEACAAVEQKVVPV